MDLKKAKGARAFHGLGWGGGMVGYQADFSKGWPDIRHEGTTTLHQWPNELVL